MKTVIKSYSPEIGRVYVEYTNDSGASAIVSIDAIKSGVFLTKEELDQEISKNAPTEFLNELAERKEILETTGAPDYLKALIGSDDIVVSSQVMRQRAYFAEADPLFFKSQRGDATIQEWLDKVAEIKSRYPDE